MAVVIKRTKGGRTHFATGATPAGTVTGWCPDDRLAFRFPEELAHAVAAAHQGTRNAGTLEFSDEGGKVLAVVRGHEPEPKAETETDLRTERDEFRQQALTLGAECEALAERELIALARIGALEAEVARRVEDAALMDTIEASRVREIAALKAQLAEANELIASAK